MVALRYPSSELDSNVKTTRVKFSAAYPTENISLGSVMLYMPQGVSIGDSAEYGTVDMGLIGGNVKKAYDQFKESKEEGKGNFESFATGVDRIFKDLSLESAGAAGISAMPNQTIRDIASLETRTVINPRTNSIFRQVGLRSFSFSFKMIAESKEESIAITNIVNFFRQNFYPELVGGGNVAKFPPTWKIDFLYGKGSAVGVNPWIPKIHECFLTEFSSSFNNDANSFHSS